MITFLLCSGLLAFQNDDLTLNERYRVEYVLLEIFATDRKGRPILDLEATDFEVKENRKKVAISFFDVLDFRQNPRPIPDPQQIDTSIPNAEPEQEAPAEKPLQQFILAIDLGSAQLKEVRETFHQLRNFLSTLDERVSYKIDLYSMEYGSLTKGFVERPQLALDALSQFESRYMDRLDTRHSTESTFLDMGKPGQRNGSRGGLLLSGVNDMFSLEKAFDLCQRMGPIEGNRCIDETLAAFVDEQEIRSESILGRLEILTYKFEEVNSMKIMLLISPGFALRSLSSAYALAKAYKTGEPLGLSNPQLISNDQFRRVVHACTKNRVIFHTFDIYNHDLSFRRNVSAQFNDQGGGAASRSSISGIYRNYELEISEGLRSLAEESGGTFTQSSHFKSSMNRTLESNRFFYLIGYDSPEGKSGKFRKIKISAKRKGVRLKHRKGYYGR